MSTGLYDELGLDSFEAFRLLLLIEELAGVDFPTDTLPELWVVGDAYRYYERLAAEAVTHSDP
jgi:acyl carrier protein